MSPRTYNSKVRADAARSTRALILDAARTLFAEAGYAKTSVAAIAVAAGVALNTVYTSVGGKPDLILALVEDASSDTLIDSALERIDELTDGGDILRLAAETGAEVTRRQGTTLAILLDNRTAEPAVEAAADTAIARYRERLTHIARRLHAVDAIRPGLELSRTADILWFYFGMPAWSTIRQLGWDWDEGTTWLCAQAVSALLPAPSGGPGSAAP